jgi:hypothetical protein
MSKEKEQKEPFRRESGVKPDPIERSNRIVGCGKVQTFPNAAERWLESRRPQHAPKIIDISELAINHLKIHFGGMFLSNISPADIASYQRVRTEEGAAERTVCLEVAVLRAILSKAKWEEAHEEAVKGFRRSRELRCDSELKLDPISRKAMADHFSLEVVDPVGPWRRLTKKVKNMFKRDSGLRIDSWMEKFLSEYMEPKAVEGDLDPALPRAEDKQKIASVVAAVATPLKEAGGGELGASDDGQVGLGSGLAPRTGEISHATPASLTPQAERTSSSTSLWPGLVSAAFLLGGVFGQWPYAFYVLLRVVVCFSAAYTVVNAHSMRKSPWAWVMAAVAVVFNPLIPLKMSRSDWSPIDLAAAGVFLTYLLTLWKRERPLEKSRWS